MDFTNPPWLPILDASFKEGQVPDPFLVSPGLPDAVEEIGESRVPAPYNFRDGPRQHKEVIFTTWVDHAPVPGAGRTARVHR